MFEWHHEYSAIVDLPVSQLFAFTNDFNNWPLWMDQFESFHIEKVDANETTLIAKVKNRNIYIPILFKVILPLKKYQLYIKAPFFKQTSTITYQEISTSKSKYTAETTVKSFLTPFMKSYYKRKVETQYPKFLKALSDFKASLS